MTTLVTFSKEYIQFLNALKQDIQTSRIKAALSVNRELVLLYWRIRKCILEKQEKLGWGSKIVEHLACDLKHVFPDMKGFSKQNLFYMRQFALSYMDYQFVQQVAGQIPWSHNCTLMDIK